MNPLILLCAASLLFALPHPAGELVGRIEAGASLHRSASAGEGRPRPAVSIEQRATPPDPRRFPQGFRLRRG